MSNKKIIIINLLAMLLVLVAAPLVALSWLDSYTMHGKVITVPNISGMQLGDVENRRLISTATGDGYRVRTVPDFSIIWMV